MLGLLGLAISIGGIVLLWTHWDLVDAAFVKLLT